MTVYKETIEVKSNGKTPTYIDITKDVRRVIEESGIKNGICAVISPHTCLLYTSFNDGGIDQCNKKNPKASHLMGIDRDDHSTDSIRNTKW